MYDLITKDMLPIYIILGASDFAKKMETYPSVGQIRELFINKQK